MLVLSRYANGRVVIVVGGQVVASLMVTEIRGDKVRLGFEAPDHVEIHREEVWEAMERDRGRETEDEAENANRTHA